MQPAGRSLPPLGLGLAMLAALGVAGVTITIRQIGKTERTPTIVLWFTCFAMLVTGVFLPFFGQAHDAETWAILLALGLSGGIGQLFLTSSLRFAPVPVVVPFDYTQLLWAVLLGWLLWDTHPATTTWLGAAIIVASGLYTLYREHKLGRDTRQSGASPSRSSCQARPISRRAIASATSAALRPVAALSSQIASSLPGIGSIRCADHRPGRRPRDIRSRR